MLQKHAGDEDNNGADEVSEDIKNKIDYLNNVIELQKKSIEYLQSTNSPQSN